MSVYSITLGKKWENIFIHIIRHLSYSELHLKLANDTCYNFYQRYNPEFYRSPLE